MLLVVRATFWANINDHVEQAEIMPKITYVRGCRIEPRADLSDETLDDTSLVGANLQSANMEEASLIGAVLHHADLRGANLRRAKLWSADLTGAHLEGADLSEVRHTYELGARLLTAEWTGATYSARTIFPDSFDPVAAGMILTG